jgi:hypothetical protein
LRELERLGRGRLKGCACRHRRPACRTRIP